MATYTSNRLKHKINTMLRVGFGGTISFGIIGAWTADETFFTGVILPVLNRIDPELSHRIAVNITKYHLTKSFEKEGSPLNMETRVSSINLTNPVGIAAGFDKNAECISGIKRLGFAWAEVGSVTPLPQAGNPKPRVFRLPQDLAVLNRYGFNNEGHEIVHERIENFKRMDPTYPVGVNLGANKNSDDRVEDYCKGIRRFSDVADYFVINVSSPNTPNLRDLQKSDSLTRLLQKCLQTRDEQERFIPLFLKVAPDLTNDEIDSICKTIKDGKRKIQGLIVSNTTISRKSLTSPENLRNQIGGLSGKPLSNISTDLIRKFYKNLKGQNITIIGVGGIFNGKDAFEKIAAGANVVQVYTALAYRGPCVAHKVKNELALLLIENGFKSIEEAVGSSLE